MNLLARYAYESEGRCFAQLPEWLWTQEAKAQQLAECIAAIDSFFTGITVESFYYRRSPRPLSDACTDVPRPVKRPRYSVSNFDIVSLA